MKKLFFILTVLFCSIPMLWAVDGTDQHLSPDEFRTKQQEFLTEKAELTKEEAAKFFPIYFELQDKKKRLSDDSWNLLRQGKNENVTEEQYKNIVEKVCDNRIASDRLDRVYLERFKKILSFKKIYLIQRAEMRFHREMLRGFNDRGGQPRDKR